MTRAEMIKFLKENHNVKVTHELFAEDEYLISRTRNEVYDENGYLFEDWHTSRHNGIRMRQGGSWEDGWSVKMELNKKIEDMIFHTFRRYGCKKNVEQMEKLKTICMNEIKAHPGLKDTLTYDKALEYFIIQMAFENVSMKNDKYIVTAIRDTDETTGVEIAGLFDTKEKAYDAKEKVEKWMQKEGYEDYAVFANQIKTNHLAWYEIEESDNKITADSVSETFDLRDLISDEVQYKNLDEEFVNKAVQYIKNNDRLLQMLDAIVEEAINNC